mmetsp:Transcript_106611/g.308481  ORF Transcript_106611/g.308481 Transcript_106611/m.308481 type:complete len:219 (-) Transcript_106611:139-795(-)
MSISQCSRAPTSSRRCKVSATSCMRESLLTASTWTRSTFENMRPVGVVLAMLSRSGGRTEASKSNERSSSTRSSMAGDTTISCAGTWPTVCNPTTKFGSRARVSTNKTCTCKIANSSPMVAGIACITSERRASPTRSSKRDLSTSASKSRNSHPTTLRPKKASETLPVSMMVMHDDNIKMMSHWVPVNDDKAWAIMDALCSSVSCSCTRCIASHFSLT